MKIYTNQITFVNKTKTYNEGGIKTHEIFDDNNILIKRIQYDSFDRAIDTKTFNVSGEITDHMHKEYFENGYVETFKNATQEYTRKAYTIIKDTLTHRVEEYISKTSPENNYINEFVRDLSGKLIRIINNGKITQL